MPDRWIEYRDVAEVVAAPANPKAHDIPTLQRSLARFDYIEPITLDERTGRLIAGHGRLEAVSAARAAGLPAPDGIQVDAEGRWLIPVTRGWASKNDDEAVAALIGLNQTVISPGWIGEDLAPLLARVVRTGGVEGIGLTSAEAAAILRRHNADDRPMLTDVDDVPPVPEEPISKPGQLWRLGPHRLMVGDATDPSCYDRLLTGERVRLVWTDPPYGVDYVGKTGSALTIQNDALSLEDLEALLRSAFTSALAASEPGAAWYVAAPCAPPPCLAFYRVLTDLGIWRQTLVWVKDRFVLSRGDYHYRHEDLLYGAAPGAEPPDVPPLPEPSSEYEEAHQVLAYGWKTGAAHQRLLDRKQDTVWEIPRPAASREHPCLPPGEDVLTDQGWRPIETLDVGDRVLSHDGEFHKVEGVTSTPFVGEVVVVESAGTHGPTRATGNHPFLVSRDGQVGWLPADQLRPGDLALTPVIDRPSQIVDSDWAWAVGLWAAEGSTQRAGHGQNRYLVYAIHADEGDLFQKRLELAFPGASIKRYSNGTNSITLRIFDPNITAEVVRIAGSYAHLKRLDPEVFTWDAGARRALLDGYLAGDGYHLRSEHRAKTVSSDLAASLMLLSESVGRSFTARLYAGGMVEGFGRRMVARPCWHMVFRDAPRRTVEFEGATFGARRIRSVSRELHRGVVLNLMVEGAHTFHTVAGMTHNTMKPVGLIVRSIDNSTEPGDLVLDPFAGSGSTMIACHATARTARLIELDPRYGDVICRRWQAHTGVLPVNEDGIEVDFGVPKETALVD